jgi:hypothetical protein
MFAHGEKYTRLLSRFAAAQKNMMERELRVFCSGRKWESLQKLQEATGVADTKHGVFGKRAENTLDAGSVIHSVPRVPVLFPWLARYSSRRVSLSLWILQYSFMLESLERSIVF